MADTKQSSSTSASGPLAQLRQVAERNPITEKLYDVGEDYLKTKAENLISSAGKKLGETTQRLNDTAEGGGSAGMAVKGAEKLAEGSSPASAALSAAGSGIKDKITGLFGKGKGKGAGGKVVNIVEDIDVGVPLREAYNQWTQFQEFTSFAKGVTGADKSDDVTSTWKFKIFWSDRSMRATISEQVPDERIAWNSDGSKGSIKGVVTFHPLGDNLTKILMVIEYYPAGFFEKTGNIWRAQGRRARLDLKHFRRFITMQGEASDNPWRGEIRDGEVSRTHEEVVEAEESEQPAGESQDAEGAYREGEDADEYDGDEDEDVDEGEYDEGEYDEGEYDEEDEEPEEYADEYDEYEDDPEDEYDEAEPESRPRGRRQRAGAGR